MLTIPERFPAQVPDLTLQAWQEIGMGDMQIQMELHFTERLDAERLEKAYRLLLDQEPVLGCRVVVAGAEAWFQRLPPDIVHRIVRAASADDFLRFRDAPVEAGVGPQVRVCLWPAPDGDRLLIKVAHQAADAGGTKDVATILAQLYSRLGREPGYIPEPNLTGTRHPEQLLRQFTRRTWISLFFLFLRKTFACLYPTIKTQMLPLPEGPSTPWSYALRHIPPERTQRLAAYGRERDATINDLISAAYYRSLAACADWNGKTPLRLFTTLDLRRWYLPGGRAEAVCNLSGFEWAFLQRRLGRDFAETLARVSAISRKHKAHLPGLGDLFLFNILKKSNFTGYKRFFGRFFRMVRSTGSNAVALTNMGPILPENVTFDAAVPQAAFLIVPPIHPPLFGVGLSGYADTLTLSASTTAATLSAIDRFFDRLLQELPE